MEIRYPNQFQAARTGGQVLRCCECLCWCLTSSSSSFVYITSWMKNWGMSFLTLTWPDFMGKNMTKRKETWWSASINLIKLGIPWNFRETHVTTASLLQRSWRHSSLIQNGQKSPRLCLGNILSSHVFGDNLGEREIERERERKRYIIYTIYYIYIHIYIYIYIYIYICIYCICIHIYIYIEREREKKKRFPLKRFGRHQNHDLRGNKRIRVSGGAGHCSKKSF